MTGREVWKVCRPLLRTLISATSDELTINVTKMITPFLTEQFDKKYGNEEDEVVLREIKEVSDWYKERRLQNDNSRKVGRI